MAYTPFNYDDDIGNVNTIVVCTNAQDNESAIIDIDQWAHAHGYIRYMWEDQLNVRRNLSGLRYFYSACYQQYNVGETYKDQPQKHVEHVSGGRDKNTAPPSSATLMREQTAGRGVALYEQQIRPVIEADNYGKYVAMDVRANVPLDYEIGSDQIITAERIMARRPDAILYTLRVGYPAVVTMRRRST